MKHTQHKLLFSLLLPVLILLLGSCGNLAESRAAPQPDQLQIQVIDPGSNILPPLLTNSNKLQIQNLYTLIYTLPFMPENQICTMEIGPSYQLAFKQNKHQLVTMNADRFGCKPIMLDLTLDHEKRPRLTNKEFWRQLDQAIHYASPSGGPHPRTP